MAFFTRRPKLGFGEAWRMGVLGQDTVNGTGILLASLGATHGFMHQIGDDGISVLPCKGGVEGLFDIVRQAETDS